jgi:MarR family transcriptional regulator, organic hydroperoxide resistance regulator
MLYFKINIKALMFYFDVNGGRMPLAMIPVYAYGQKIRSARPDSDMDFDTANRLFFRLYQASNLLHKHGTRSIADFGATTQQWAVIGALARPGIRQSGVSVKALMAFLLLSRQNLTAVLDRLDARGWTERVKDPADGRARLVRLAPEGNIVWDRMQDAIHGFYTDALKGFSEDESVQLYRLLDRVKVNLHALGPEESDEG